MKLRYSSVNYHLTTLVALLIFAAMFATEQVQAGPCGSVTFECKSTAGAKNKCGYPENECQISTPPKRYLQKFSHGNSKYSTSSSAGNVNAFNNSFYLGSYDRLTCSESSITVGSGNTGSQSYSCSTIIDTSGTTVIGECMNGAFMSVYGPLKGICEGAANTENGSFSTNGSCSSTQMSSGEDGTATEPTSSITVHSESSSVVSTEYTDQMLRADMITLMPAYCDWGHGDNRAYYHMSSDHLHVEGGKMIYRFHITDCEKEETYKVYWVEVKILDALFQVPLFSLQEEEISGSDDPAGVYGSEHEVDVPGSQCTIFEMGWFVTVVPKGGGGGGPGTGGPGHGLGPGRGPTSSE